jgi:hypothetical protein
VQPCHVAALLVDGDEGAPAGVVDAADERAYALGPVDGVGGEEADPAQSPLQQPCRVAGLIP